MPSSDNHKVKTTRQNAREWCLSSTGHRKDYYEDQCYQNSQYNQLYLHVLQPHFSTDWGSRTPEILCLKIKYKIHASTVYNQSYTGNSKVKHVKLKETILFVGNRREREDLMRRLCMPSNTTNTYYMRERPWRCKLGVSSTYYILEYKLWSKFNIWLYIKWRMLNDSNFSAQNRYELNQAVP